MLKRIMAAAAGLAIAGGVAIAAAPAASADYGDGRDSCNTGAFCVWYLTQYRDLEIEDYDNSANWDNWTSKITNDDMSWFNNGTVLTGADHVRVYTYDNYRGLTLCVHQGASGTVYFGDSDDQDDLKEARNRGNSHRWGGECLASEPQVD